MGENYILLWKWELFQHHRNKPPDIITKMPVKYTDFKVKEILWYHPVK
jgi:hypothetical protein